MKGKQYFIQRLFKHTDQYLTEAMIDIHLKQQEITGSPNFFYKGQVNTINNKSVKTLDPTLRKTYCKILEMSQNTQREKDLITRYLSLYPDCYLHQLIPEYAQHLLEIKGQCIIQPPELIQNIIKGQLIHEIL